MATVEELYTKLLGRAPDAEGLAYWQGQFGSSVEPTEVSTFLNVAKAIEPTSVNDYLVANNDVATSYLNNSYGLTPDQFATTHYNLYGADEQRAAPTTEAAPVSDSTPTSNTIKDYRGQTYDVNQLKSLAAQLATISDAKNLSGGAYGEKEGNIGFAYSDLAGALGASPTSFDQVLMDAARQLVDKGITDINQIKPPEGADANYTGDGVGAGHTYTGPGSTSYAVDFKDGKPYFKTTGNSSSFFSSDLGKAVMAGGAYFGAPLLSGAIGGATGLTGAALTGATGAAIGGTGAALTGSDVLTGALTGGALGYGGGLLSENLGTTAPTTGTTGTTSGTNILDYSAPTAQGGLGLQGTAALDGSLSSGLAAPAGGSLGGGLGLNAATAGNLGYMGGAQGLTANAAGGGTLSAGGVNTGLFNEDNLYNSSSGLTNIASGAGTGLTASQVIKAIPLVTTVNALVGDPLGLQPKPPTTTTTPTGFGVVEIPSGWKPPTYSQSNFQPIDLNSIFTDQNLLTGTQWQGLPNQRNMTFNDIFAAGKQATPMGTPVNINNIVSAILGQTATSQKSA